VEKDIFGCKIKKLKEYFLQNSFVKRTLKGDVFFRFSCSMLVSRVVTMSSSIMVLRWIDPASMGIWQGLLLAQSYFEIMRLGIVRGLNRELPYLLGSGDFKQAQEVASTALFYSIFVGLVGLLLFLAAPFVFHLTSKEWLTGLISMGIIWASASMSSYLQATFRAQTDFKTLANIQLIEAGLYVITLYLVAMWGYTGMAIRATTVPIVVTFLFYRMRPLRVPSRFSGVCFKRLVKTGMPIFFASILYTFAMGFDRLILLQYGQIELLGFYAPVAAIISLTMSLQTSFSSYGNPRMAFRFGKHNKLAPIWRDSLLIAMAAVVVSIPIAIGGWLTIPFTIDKFFPQYVQAKAAIQLTLLASILWAVKTANVSLYVLKSWRYLYLYMGVFALTKYLFPYYFAKQMDPLTGVALGGLIASFVMAIVAFLTTYLSTHFDSHVAIPAEVRTP
jgi:O-antigen/teichoic acid export membrane protein